MNTTITEGHCFNWLSVFLIFDPKLWAQSLQAKDIKTSLNKTSLGSSLAT